MSQSASEEHVSLYSFVCTDSWSPWRLYIWSSMGKLDITWFKVPFWLFK